MEESDSMDSPAGYNPQPRALAMRVACGVIAAMLFAFGCFQLVLPVPDKSLLMLCVALIFARHAYSYTGDKDYRRESNVKLMVATFVGLILPFTFRPDTPEEWTLAVRVGCAACHVGAQVLLFLAFFRKPYVPTAAAREIAERS